MNGKDYEMKKMNKEKEMPKEIEITKAAEIQYSIDEKYLPKSEFAKAQQSLESKIDSSLERAIHDICSDTHDMLNTTRFEVNSHVSDILTEKLENLGLVIRSHYCASIDEFREITEKRVSIEREKLESAKERFRQKSEKYKEMISFARRIYIAMGVAIMILIFSLFGLLQGYQARIDEFKTEIEELNETVYSVKAKVMTIEETLEAAQMAMAAREAIAQDESSANVTSEETSREEEKKSVNLSDISKPSNLSASQLNSVINSRLKNVGKSSSKLSNLGDALVKMEEESGVNALFCLAVASLESGYGTSDAAMNKNNLFGLMRSNSLIEFSSVSECISYWGNLMKNHYINSNRDSIEDIQPKYCPDSETWAPDVSYLFNTYSSISSK